MALNTQNVELAKRLRLVRYEQGLDIKHPLQSFTTNKVGSPHALQATANAQNGLDLFPRLCPLHLHSDSAPFLIFKVAQLFSSERTFQRQPPLPERVPCLFVCVHVS